MLHIKFTSRPFDKLKSRCAVVTTFEDARPLQGHAALVDWRFNGLFSKVLLGQRFKGDFQETLLVPAEGRVQSHEIMMVGLGARHDFSESFVARFIHFLAEKMARMKVADFALSLSDIIADRFEWRNGVRLLVSRLHDFPEIERVELCEPEDCVRDARRRHMDFGLNVEVLFETTSL